MGKLKGNDLKMIASSYEDISKAWHSQIYFCFASVMDGEDAFNILKRVYADECNYDAWSGWFGSGDKRDFYLGFKSRQVRDDVYDEIMDSIAEYRKANIDDIGYTSSAGGSKSDPEEEPEDNTKTYVIVGAVAAIIILLLLWRK